MSGNPEFRRALDFECKADEHCRNIEALRRRFRHSIHYVDDVDFANCATYALGIAYDDDVIEILAWHPDMKVGTAFVEGLIAGEHLSAGWSPITQRNGSTWA